MPMDSLVEESGTPVDPKRVFSALMKEIDPSAATSSQKPRAQSPTVGEDIFASDVMPGLHPHVKANPSSEGHGETRTSFSSDLQRLPSHAQLEDSVQSKATIKSTSFKSLGRALKATIRTVTPSAAQTSPGPERTTSVYGLVKIPRPVSDESAASTPEGAQKPTDEHNTLTSIDFTLPPREYTTRKPEADNVVKPTTDQIQSRVEKARGRWKTPLEENKIPLLPRQTERAYAVTNIATETITQRFAKEKTPPPALTGAENVTPVDRGPQRLQPHTSPRPRPLFSPLSPSIYSRNTDGLSIMPNDSVMSLDGAVDDDGSSAVIITSRAVKSYVVGTPSPERTVKSTRSSRDWKAWLSHEVSELESMPREDMSLHGRYSPENHHLREFTQISDEETTTVRVESVEDHASTTQQREPSETPPNSRYNAGKASVPNRSSNPDVSPISSSDDEVPTARRVTGRTPPSPMSGPRPKQRRVSSILSEDSPLSQARPGSRESWERSMNGPFPFIETRRRSSYNSARGSRCAPSSSASGSSSSKHTPSPKVYSDFSAPSTDRTSRHAPYTRLKRSELLGGDKENVQQSATPSFAERINTVAGPSDKRLNRAQSSLGASNAGQNSLAPSATHSASAIDHKQRQGAGVEPPLPRIRLKVRPLTPGKLTTRPKSAFDLRNPLAPTIPSTRHSESPPKKEPPIASPSIERKPVAGPLLEGDTLRMLLESPWSAGPSPSSSPVPRHGGISPAPGDWIKKPALHLKHSSSTLALNKEPSPGTEEWHIDSLLERRASILSRSGSVTPGQRMAERFIKEREAPSGAGSPASFNRGLDKLDNRSMTGSPVFV